MIPFLVMSEQDQFVEAFKAFGDPVRMKILELLWRPHAECCSPEDRICACDLEDKLGLSQPTISHHMKTLIRAGLVLATKEGRTICYNINRYSFAAMADLVSKYAEGMEKERTRAKAARRRTKAAAGLERQVPSTMKRASTAA
jgi:ArsR family transcriptional regulator